MEKYQYHFGRKFGQNKNNKGYWVATEEQSIYAHRWVWMNHHGEIPDGCHIHHKNGDKSDNSIENLELMKESDHKRLHWKENKVHLYGLEWHKSEEGRQFHRESWKVYWKNKPLFSCQCIICNKSIQVKSVVKPKYCGWRCRTEANKIDRSCQQCCKTFRVVRSTAQKYCSAACGYKNHGKVYGKKRLLQQSNL